MILADRRRGFLPRKGTIGGITAIIVAMNASPESGQPKSGQPKSEQPGLEWLLPWIGQSLARRENILATSNQGTILLYRGPGPQPGMEEEFIIKTPMGRGLLLSLRRKTLRREHEAYLRLAGLPGVPVCHGLLDGPDFGPCLVLEHVRGTAYRDANWQEREAWFAELLEILRAMHARGVSHGDLKSKGNLLVTDDERPCIVDFGTAFVYRPGFHPINNWLYRTGKRLDLNAWVKHKYHGHYGRASAADREILDYSWLETLVRKLRRCGVRVKIRIS